MIYNTVEYYAAFKKKEILPFATTWRVPEDTMLSKIGQAQKYKYGMIPIL